MYSSSSSSTLFILFLEKKQFNRTRSVPLYTVNHKKRDILLLTVILANLNRFLQFLYNETLQQTFRPVLSVYADHAIDKQISSKR